MRKTTIVILLAGVLLVSGCARETAPGKEESPPVTQTQEPKQPTTQPPGPETQPTVPGETVTIEPLELPTEETDLYEGPDISGLERSDDIFIATDLHYLAESLSDGESGFQYMVEHGDGKLANYVGEITDAFIEEVLEARPKILIISGDLSLNGEKQSHLELAEKLGRVETAGIPVAVIPGNHDINCNEAAAYIKNERIPAEKTAPEEFAKIYGEFGYDEAISRDPNSLSYTYWMEDDTWLLMLDSNQYEHGAKIGGMIRLETYEWIEDQLEEASDEGVNLIPVAHHNLLEESQVYLENCTIEHAEELERVLVGWGMDLFLSGHLHVQHFKSSSDEEIYEIVTSSLSTAPCQYGILTYDGYKSYNYRTKAVDMAAWAKKHGMEDDNLLNFPEYSKVFLEKVFYNKVMDTYKNSDIPIEDRKAMAVLYAKLNTWSYAGSAVEIATEVTEDPAFALWKEYKSDDILFLYMEEILRDATHDYNTLHRE